MIKNEPLLAPDPDPDPIVGGEVAPPNEYKFMVRNTYVSFYRKILSTSQLYFSVSDVNLVVVIAT